MTCPLPGHVQQQEGEIPDPFNMEDKGKKWILIVRMLGISCPLHGKFHEAFIKLHSIHPGQIFGNPVLHSDYAALVTQSNSTSSTATKQAHKVNSNDVVPGPDQHEGENSQKEVLNHKCKAPGPGLQASNGSN
jgi:hypothetical protein